MGLFSGSVFGSLIDGLAKGGSTGVESIVRDPREDYDILIQKKEPEPGSLSESLEDIKEFMTDGFYEMVIKGNSDYKTSFEIQDEANGIIARQSRIYRDKCSELNILLNEVNNQNTYLYEKKINLSKRLNTLFEDKTESLGEISYKIWMEPSYVHNQSNIAKLCDMMGLASYCTISDRKDSANEFLEDAKDYKVYVSKKVSELNRIKLKTNAIKQVLQEEINLIEALETSISMQRDLDYSMIANQLEKLITQYVLDENNEKNKIYTNALHQLKNLCENV